jgi:hypothetical protein
VPLRPPALEPSKLTAADTSLDPQLSFSTAATSCLLLTGTTTRRPATADPASVAFLLAQSSAVAPGSACRVAIHRSSQLHPTLKSPCSDRDVRFFVPPPPLLS